MYTLDTIRFHEALSQKGYHSIEHLAQSLGMHRNTIHYYLSGRGIFPAGFEKVILALGLEPAQILIKKKDTLDKPYHQIAPLVDRLHEEFGGITLVLFGSRARGKTQKYSDWDIGVFSRSGLPHDLYRRIVMRKNDLCEDLPFFVDVVNLNNADASFLRQIAPHWVFLTGRLQDWISLQRRISV